MDHDQAIEAAARAIAKHTGWPVDYDDLEPVVQEALRNTARAAAPILMEQGAGLALEAVTKWLRKDRPFYDLNPLADEMVAQLDPAEIVKEAEE